jgi:hypothetical protein
MKKLLIAAAAATTLLAVPAMADELFVGADQSGVGVQVGPFGVGIGPRFSGDPYYRDYHATDGTYAAAPGECQIIRERYVTPSGRVIVRQHRLCN